MIDRLNEQATRAIMLAEEESRRLGHNFVGTEQILLGLIGEGKGIAAVSLKSMGANLKDLRVEVEKIIGRGPGTDSESIPFTPRAKKVMEMSWEEARLLGDNYIGTEHLLLGLIREGKGSASKVLTSCKIEAANLACHVHRILDSKKNCGPAACRAGLSETPTLDQFGSDLTQAERDGQLDPVVARDREINRVIRIAGRRTRPHPLLVGENGVGKSAVVSGLVRRINNLEVPDYLQNRRVVRLDILYLLAQPDSGNLIKECLAEAQALNLILIIDEMHLLLAPGDNRCRQDASYLLNFFLSQTKIHCIGSAPLGPYQKVKGACSPLARQFQPVLIPPPGAEDAATMLRSLQEIMEKYYEVAISDQAIEQAIKLSDQLIKDEFLPGKAVDILEEACRLVSLRFPGLVAAMKSDLARIRRDKETCISHQHFAEASTLREQETSLAEKLRNIQQTSETAVVGSDDIIEIVDQWTASS
jgi:ATP-dependent Clp protease ATP-binding subunit ClpC